MVCAICGVRRARRYCPGVRGEICTLCCGAEREVTVDCPFECPHLRDARKHDRPSGADPRTFPNQDIKLSEAALRENEELLVFMGRALLNAALETSGAIDYDVREALEALIQTYRTLGRGIIYETRPSNLIAANICRLFQQSLEKARAERVVRARDSDVLTLLVFLQRLELDNNNGRRRGRAFLDFLRGFLAHGQESGLAASTTSLIVPWR